MGALTSLPTGLLFVLAGAAGLAGPMVLELGPGEFRSEGCCSRAGAARPRRPH